MPTQDPPEPAPAAPSLAPQLAAGLQDHLRIAAHDLERLQALLAHACDSLMLQFSGAVAQLQALKAAPRGRPLDGAELDPVLQGLGAAVTGLQFQDLAEQLIRHTQHQLQHCVAQISADTGTPESAGPALLRPNPVPQSEVEAGSIELF